MNVGNKRMTGQDDVVRNSVRDGWKHRGRDRSVSCSRSPPPAKRSRHRSRSTSARRSPSPKSCKKSVACSSKAVCSTTAAGPVTDLESHNGVDSDGEQFSPGSTIRYRVDRITFLPKGKVRPASFYGWKKAFAKQLLEALGAVGSPRQAKKDPLEIYKAAYTKAQEGGAVSELKDLGFEAAEAALSAAVVTVKTFAEQCLHWKQTSQIEGLQKELRLETHK